MNHQRQSYLRPGGRVLTLFGYDYQTNDNDNSVGMTVGSLNTTTMVLTQQNTAENKPSPLPPANAPWHTRKTILFAEAIVVTAIVLPLIFCFFYQRSINKTNRLPPVSRAIGNANAVEEEHDEDDQPPRTILQRIGAVLSYPFRHIESAVHSWSTANEDITFLRGVMERLEEERVAQLEDFDQRGERLKVAFSKGESVWEIAEEHFIPPPTLYALSPSLFSTCIDEKDAKSTQSYSVNEDKEGRPAIEEDLSKVELNNEISNDADDATNPATDSGSDDAIIVSADNSEDQESVKEVETAKDSESNNAEQIESEQNHQISSLMMDERNGVDRPLSSLMGSEGEDFVGELTPSTPPRSSSPLDTGETPAYLYLSYRRNRSRTNTNETLNSLPSSSTHSNAYCIEATASSSHSTNAMNLVSSTESSNTNSFEEEDLKSVPNNCAICLSEYVAGDTVVTSCDPLCSHAFHQECIVEWLVKMQVGAPCPCCRRTFVELSPVRPVPPTARDDNDSNVDNVNSRAETGLTGEEEQRFQQLRRSIEMGLRRGGRTFDFSIISLR